MELEYFSLSREWGLVCLRAFCFLLLFSSGNVRCELVNYYFRDRREKDYPDTC